MPVTSPGVAYPSLRRDSLAPGLALEQRLAPIPANENTCTFRTIERDARGAFVRWRPAEARQVSVARGPADTVLTRYEVYAFTAKGDQTAEAQCVLRRGAAARAFALGFFARPTTSMRGAAAWSVTSASPPLASIVAGTTCLLDVVTWDMTCGNETCYPMFASRVPRRARHGMQASVTRATPVGSTPAGLVGGWECSGGGGISLNGNGTLTYHPPGSGDGDGDGGTGSGCGGETPGDSSGDGTVTPPGSGGNDYSGWGAACDSVTLAPPVSCNPNDPDCYVTLDSLELAALERGIAGARQHEAFSDPIAAAICDTMVRRARALLDSGWVYKGNVNVPNHPFGPHTGGSVRDPADPERWWVHIEAHILNQAKDTSLYNHDDWTRIAATALLHEAAHTLGRTHPGESSTPYTTPPFSVINSPGANGCIP